MDQPQGVWKAYAIRYARHERTERENFLWVGGDPHDAPMPMDYFVWAVRSGERVFVVDTGFDEAMGRRRRREMLHPPAEGLRAIGIEPAQVRDVIVTHLHYDHCGNHKMFPEARYHLQDREMFFATGRHMCYSHMQIPFEEEDVVEMVRKVFARRVIFHEGDAELAPGLTVHRVGGHSMGLQVVRVNTRRGWVVLASDASHYYANFVQFVPYPVTYSVAEAIEAFRRVIELTGELGEGSPARVIPGHDPMVLEKYPPPRPELAGWIARLD